MNLVAKRKIALIHDWLTGMRGGEKVLEVLCELFPTADIYTLVHIPGQVSSLIESHPIHTSFLQRPTYAALVLLSYADALYLGPI